MKKAIAILFVVSFMVALFASCRTQHTCPAYHNGSAQKTAPVDNTRA